MSRILTVLFATLVLAGCATTPGEVGLPRVDYHQHLVSPAFAPIVGFPAVDGPAAVARLDEAGVEKAVILSVGYSFADERKGLTDPDALTRRENDWTSEQVVAGRGRLIGFCSANPLREAALGEIERCLSLPGMRGIKLHLGNSGVSLRRPDHADRIGEVFALAERSRVAVMVHMRARGGENFGAPDAEVFLDRIVSRAPHVEIVIAHLGATSPGYPDQNDEVMAVFGAAAERGDRRMENLYFDAAANLTSETTPEEAEKIRRRIRQIGVERFLYGSDLVGPPRTLAGDWGLYRSKLGLTDAELHTITRNRTRFSR